MNITGTKVAAAFVKARQGMASSVTKDGKGNFGKYTTLAAVMEAIAEQLNKNDLAVIQEATVSEQGIVVTTSVLHNSGETITFEPLPLPLAQRTAQGVGSAITYGRRYQLCSICGLAPDDDDGEAASKAAAGAELRAAGPETAKAVSPPPAANSASGDPSLRFGTGRSAEPPQPEEIRKLGAITKAQRNELHALGENLYNGEWEAKRPDVIAGATKGKHSSLNDLTQAQAVALTAILHKRLVERIVTLATERSIDIDLLLVAHNQPSLIEASPVALTHIWKDVKAHAHALSDSEMRAQAA